MGKGVPLNRHYTGELTSASLVGAQSEPFTKSAWASKKIDNRICRRMRAQSAFIGRSRSVCRYLMLEMFREGHVHGQWPLCLGG